MSRKLKIILAISVAVNIILFIILTLEYNKKHTVTEKIFLNLVRHELLLLNENLDAQKNNGWTEPVIVQIQLIDVLDAIYLAVSTGIELNALSKKEIENYNEFWRIIRNSIPSHEFTETDKVNLEQLQKQLDDVGIINGTNTETYNSFRTKIELLVDKVN
ncbi:hypothetical protein [Alkalihalobacterium sp. APHAB7]|uniref:hypothetical protein n=1 Tax=Alkalihalobacterium sp. APHAB7 TaxID=3402081 RepID=UPI003AAC4B79